MISAFMMLNNGDFGSPLIRDAEPLGNCQKISFPKFTKSIDNKAFHSNVVQPDAYYKNLLHLYLILVTLGLMTCNKEMLMSSIIRRRIQESEAASIIFKSHMSF